MHLTLHMVLLVISSGLVGLCIGIFLNKLIHRLPLMLLASEKFDTVEPYWGLFRPAWQCVHCTRPLRWQDNIPLASFAWLRGRCGHYVQPISWRYPLVELLSAVWLMSCAAKWGLSASAMSIAVAGLCLIALMFIDAEHMLLPDALTQPLLWGGLLSSCAGWTTTHSEHAILGAALGYALVAAPAALYRWRTGVEGLGGGDAKLLAAIGAWQGFVAPPAVLMFAGIGSLIWLLGWRRHVLMTRTPYPFGPWLAAASMIGWLWLG